jgi:hypothetical protein
MPQLKEPTKLLEAERAAHLRVSKLMTEYRAIEERATAALEAGGNADIGELTASLSQLRIEADLVRSAIAGLRKRRAEAIPLAYQARAVELRAQASERRREADRIYSQAEKHLAKLSELMGVTYTRAILNAQPVGQWELPIHALIGPAGVLPLEDRTPAEMVSGVSARGSGTYAPTRSRKLVEESMSLEAQAHQFENFAVSNGGDAEGATLEELIESACSDPLRIQPAIADIEKWVTDVDRVLVREAAVLQERPRRYRLRWSDGTISEADSCIEVGASKVSLSEVETHDSDRGLEPRVIGWTRPIGHRPSAEDEAA